MTPKGGDLERGGQALSGPEGFRRFAIRRRRIGRDLREQALENRIAAGVDLLPQHTQDMRPPRAVVHDPRPQARRMQSEANGIDCARMRSAEQPS